jgi:hypothetical protein
VCKGRGRAPHACAANCLHQSLGSGCNRLPTALVSWPCRMHVHVQLCTSSLPSYKAAGDLRRPGPRTSLYRYAPKAAAASGCTFSGSVSGARTQTRVVCNVSLPPPPHYHVIIVMPGGGREGGREGGGTRMLPHASCCPTHTRVHPAASPSAFVVKRILLAAISD